MSGLGYACIVGAGAATCIRAFADDPSGPALTTLQAPQDCGFPAVQFRSEPDGARAIRPHHPCKGRHDHHGRQEKEPEMRKYLEIGGVIATVVLIVFGVVVLHAPRSRHPGSTPSEITPVVSRVRPDTPVS